MKTRVSSLISEDFVDIYYYELVNYICFDYMVEDKQMLTSNVEINLLRLKLIY